MNCSNPRNLALFTLVCAGLVFGGGCGSGSSTESSLTKPGPVPQQVTDAGTVDLAAFPASAGATLQQLAGQATEQLQYAAATATFTPGGNRIAFGLIDASGNPSYAPTAIYIAKSPSSPVLGPFPAPADPMVPQAAYLSKGAALDTAGLKAIYEAQANIPSTGKWLVLALSKSGTALQGATGEVVVAPSTKIPGVGDKAPVISTPTASGGDALKAIDTRIPPAPSLHQVNFKQVVGKAPIALLFGTPALCQSRVCGPVTDLLLQLQAAYGTKIDAIHQEVYLNNKPPTLNPQMLAYNLETEPWFFTVGKDGRIKARLEGAFGINAMNAAIQAALK